MNSAPKRLFIHAVNIHTGGGRVLLESLTSECSFPIDKFIFANEKMLFKANSVNIKKFKNNIFSRLRAEFTLLMSVKINDVVLCFGNLPPIFDIKGKIYIFIQNRYIIEKNSTSKFKLTTRLRLVLERLWLRIFLKPHHIVLVQTPSMRHLAKSLPFFRRNRIEVLPFVNGETEPKRSHTELPKLSPRDSFIYVATGEPHKNHIRLIEAWKILASEGIYPVLRLTVPYDDPICAAVAAATSAHQLRIENIGQMEHPAILELYQQSDALIYPSLLESFGIPLVEAKIAGIAVLASERDFVRDIIDPEETFDPESAISISLAVKRFMGISKDDMKVLSAKQFLANLVDERS